MTTENNRDMRKILQMVEEGKVSAEEAEKLMDAIQLEGATTTCPWCAESIPVGLGTCPECLSRLDTPHSHPSSAAGQSVGSMDGMSKLLMIYTFVISLIVLLASFRNLPSPLIGQILLAALGMASAILMFKRNRLGWTLGAIWGALQILCPIVAGISLTRQVLHLGIYSTTNGSGMGFNVAGIILLVLFIRAGRKQRP